MITYKFVTVHLPLWKRGNEGDLFNKISPNPSFSKRGTERLHKFYRSLNI